MKSFDRIGKSAGATASPQPAGGASPLSHSSVSQPVGAHQAQGLSVADVLDRAADLIEPVGAWVQGRMARNAEGDPVPAKRADAVCFCAMGAIRHVSFRQEAEAWPFLERAIKRKRIAPWNDAPGRTQAEVVAKLRKAAALAREQGA